MFKENGVSKTRKSVKKKYPKLKVVINLNCFKDIKVC